MHYSIVELLESNEDHIREQATLDEVDDELVQLTIAVETLMSSSSSSNSDDGNKKTLSHRLNHLKRKLDIVCQTDEELDIYHIQQYEADLVDHKKELTEIRTEMLALDLDDEDEICETQSSLEDLIFRLSLKLRKFTKQMKDKSDDSHTKSHDGV